MVVLIISGIFYVLLTVISIILSIIEHVKQITKIMCNNEGNRIKEVDLATILGDCFIFICVSFMPIFNIYTVIVLSLRLLGYTDNSFKIDD